MSDPPVKGKGGSLGRPAKNTESARRYDAQRVAQALPPWFNEAERIAREFQRSGDSKHLRAFCRQIKAMLAEVERSLPQ